MKKYTVLLLYPDYANENGDGSFLAHVEANSVLEAQAEGQQTAARSGVADPKDFSVLAVFEGHLNDLKE